MKTKMTYRNKKTIAIFSANFLPNIGGVENFTSNLSETLEALGHHAIIVTNNIFDLADHELLDSNAEIYRLPCLPLINGRLPIPRKNDEFKKLIREISQRKIDYIIINTRFYPHSLIAIKIAKQMKIIPIVIDHGSDYITLGNFFTDSIIKIYEHFITTMLKKYPADYYGISQASLQWLKTFHINGKGIINNSIDSDAFLSKASKRDFRAELKLSKNIFLICFVGRLMPEKGVIPLLNCAEYYSKYNPSIHFAFAGVGPLEKEVSKRNLCNLHLLGELDPPDVAALLQQSNVFSLPSRSEGFSTSLLEASACYTPSIITNVGGVAELIPSKDYGFVIDKPTADKLIVAIDTLANNKELAYQMGQNVGKRVRSYFSWTYTANKTLTACREANRQTSIDL